MLTIIQVGKDQASCTYVRNKVRAVMEAGMDASLVTMEETATTQDAFETAMWDAAQAEEITLNDLRDEVCEDAVAHGLYDEEKYNRAHPFGLMYVCRNLALRIKAEVTELIGATFEEQIAHFTEELADIIIICLSVAGYLGIDIDAAVRRKIEINKTRPHKHGKE